MAPQTPNPHEVPLESQHSFESSSNHSVFSHSQRCTVYFSSMKYIVCCFHVIIESMMKKLPVLGKMNGK
jgi:hypothetical protein